MIPPPETLGQARSFSCPETGSTLAVAALGANAFSTNKGQASLISRQLRRSRRFEFGSSYALERA
jgi:hypothetical protein